MGRDHCMLVQLLLALSLCGCTEDIRFHTAPAGEDARAGIDAAAAESGPASACAPALSAADGIVLRASAPDGCATLAARAFRHALCTCEDLTLPAALQSDGFDSRLGPPEPGHAGGSVGTNGRLAVTAPFDIQGSLSAGSTQQSALIAQTIHIAGNVRINADLAIAMADLTIDRDLWVNGALSAVLATLRVDGSVYQPTTGAEMNITGDALAAGGFQQRTFSVAPPCPCDASPLLDFGRLAESFRARNDNAAHGVHSTALQEASGGALELPCGRYRFDGSRIVESRWISKGASALSIDGNLQLDGTLTVDLGTSGELDVFVHGALKISPRARIETARAGALRFYVAGSDEIRLIDGSGLTGNLYAPRARLFTFEELTSSGAWLVRKLSAAAPLTFHHDESVLGADPSCAAPACVGDEDCATPFLCVDQRCMANAG